MKWVVDTCVIIDVLRGDDEFSELSADALDAKMKDGLWIAPITYVGPFWHNSDRKRREHVEVSA